jgi:hypothetical protein
MLLTAQVRAADHRLIVSTTAAEQLERAIAILRRLRRDDRVAAELLLDALLIRHDLSNLYGVPGHVTPEQNVATLDEAMELALGTFGAGSRQHLRVALALSQLRTMRQDAAAGQAVLAPVLQQVRSRGDAVVDSVEFLSASIEDAIYLCSVGKVHDGIAALHGLRERVQAAHGSSSYLIEPILLGLGGCLGELGDPTAFGWFIDAYEVAAMRERPPSTHLMQRALDVFDWAISARDAPTSERFYQHAMENVEAIADAEVRDRLTINVRSARVCQLMQRGNADEAVRLAEPIIAGHNASYAGRPHDSQPGRDLDLLRRRPASTRPLRRGHRCVEHVRRPLSGAETVRAWHGVRDPSAHGSCTRRARCRSRRGGAGDDG